MKIPALPTLRSPKIRAYAAAILFILLCAITGFGGYIFFHYIYANKSKQASLNSAQKVIMATPVPTPTPIMADVLPNGEAKGWKEFTTSKFSIELPKTWEIAEWPNLKSWGEDIILGYTFTDTESKNGQVNIYGNPDETSFEIQLSKTYKSKQWSDLTEASTFYDTKSDLWSDFMRHTGGGGYAQVEITPSTLSNQKTVKRTITWTEVIEGYEAIDTGHFFPDATEQPLAVWEISYRLPLSGENNKVREATLQKILSTFKPSDNDAQTKLTKLEGEKYTYSFSYPTYFQINRRPYGDYSNQEDIVLKNTTTTGSITSIEFRAVEGYWLNPSQYKSIQIGSRTFGYFVSPDYNNGEGEVIVMAGKGKELIYEFRFHGAKEISDPAVQQILQTFAD